MNLASRSTRDTPTRSTRHQPVSIPTRSPAALTPNPAAPSPDAQLTRHTPRYQPRPAPPYFPPQHARKRRRHSPHACDRHRPTHDNPPVHATPAGPQPSTHARLAAPPVYPPTPLLSVLAHSKYMWHHFHRHSYTSPKSRLDGGISSRPCPVMRATKSRTRRPFGRGSFSCAKPIRCRVDGRLLLSWSVWVCGRQRSALPSPPSCTLRTPSRHNLLLPRPPGERRRRNRRLGAECLRDGVAATTRDWAYIIENWLECEFQGSTDWKPAERSER